MKKTALTPKNTLQELSILSDTLLQLNKTAAYITHKVNNPLFSISNSFQLAKRYLPADNERVNKAIEIHEKELKRIKTLFQELNTWMLREVEELSRADIVEMVQTAVDFVESKRKLSPSNTTIEVNKEGHSYPLTCMCKCIMLAFSDMIHNALDAVSSLDVPGKIKIDISGDEQAYRVDFIDNGPGIPEIGRADIFLPRHAPGNKEKKGLGLHISRNIVAVHGGSLTLEDTRSGGAHFVVHLPKTTDESRRSV